MKTLITFLAFWGCLLTLNAQSSVEDFVRAGVKLNDEGKYKEAIKMYEKALKSDPNSYLANYEMAYTYLAMKEYEKVLIYCDAAIKNAKQYRTEAYTLKGSTLDDMGKSQEALKVYEKALKEDPKDYMIHFNKGVTLTRLKKMDDAEASFIKAIENNIGHPGSHFSLGSIQFDKGYRSKAIMPLLFFCMLEPDTKRTQAAVEMIQKQLSSGISQTNNKQINIVLQEPEKGKGKNEGENQKLMTADLSLSMFMLAGIEVEKQAGKQSDLEKVVNALAAWMSIFDESKDKKEADKKGNEKAQKEGIWLDFYATFYGLLAKDEQSRTFVYYVFQDVNSEAKKWVETHPTEIKNFENWLKKMLGKED